MVASNYPNSISHVLKHEGGYVNHPSDPGGPTNFGITLATYRANGHPSATADDVKRMTVGEAKEIYRLQYARPIKFDDHKAGVDYSLLDYAVNSGVGRSNKVARRVCGLPDNAPLSDLMTAMGRRDSKAVIAAINAERLKFLQGLKTWPTFGKGWGSRVAGVNMVALNMAAAAPIKDTSLLKPIEHPPVGKGEVPKPKTAGPAAAGGTAAAPAGGFGFPEFVSAHPVWSAVILVAGVVAVIVLAEFAARRWQKAKQEAQTPGIQPVPELV